MRLQDSRLLAPGFGAETIENDQELFAVFPPMPLLVVESIETGNRAVRHCLSANYPARATSHDEIRDRVAAAGLECSSQMGCGDETRFVSIEPLFACRQVAEVLVAATSILGRIEDDGWTGLAVFLAPELDAINAIRREWSLLDGTERRLVSVRFPPAADAEARFERLSVGLAATAEERGELDSRVHRFRVGEWRGVVVLGGMNLDRIELMATDGPPSEPPDGPPSEPPTNENAQPGRSLDDVERGVQSLEDLEAEMGL